MLSAPSLPPGFETHRSNGPEPSAARTVHCLSALHPELDRLGFLTGTPRQSPVARVVGRHQHSVYAMGGAAGLVIWKHCLRGGIMEPLLGDLHAGTRRFLDELQLTEEALAAGSSVARIFAIAITRAGRGLSRVEILCEYCEGARDGAALLGAGAPASRVQHRVLRAAARELRRFHGAGFLHGDLNVKNILWSAKTSAPSITLIDLDPGNARRSGGGNSPLENLHRLVRSYLKGEASGSWRLSRRAALLFLNEYFRGDLTSLRDFLRTARRRARFRFLRRPTRTLTRQGRGGEGS